MAAISGGRANDERVKCLRIFTDANSETHMEDIDIDLQPRKLFKDNPPLHLTDNLPASWYNVCYVPTGVGETGWHNPPQRLLLLWLTGEVEFETSDGDIRRLPPGSVVLADILPDIPPKASWWYTWLLLNPTCHGALKND